MRTVIATFCTLCALVLAYTLANSPAQAADTYEHSKTTVTESNMSAHMPKEAKDAAAQDRSARTCTDKSGKIYMQGKSGYDQCRAAEQMGGTIGVDRPVDHPMGHEPDANPASPDLDTSKNSTTAPTTSER